MPQWDFLDFMVGAAARYPGFRLRMQTEATDLIADAGSVRGVRARAPQGELDIRAALVVGADGRHSILRERAGLVVDDLGAPMDVLWMRISRRPDDPDRALGRVSAGRLFVMINRGDYWQCALVIPKGSFADLRQKGIEAFRAKVADSAPVLRQRVDELRSWDDVRLLTVTVDRLRQWWRPGLLCIGDAAHAMSPIGGVGINLAVQDAVAAANILSAPLRTGAPSPEHLRAVQRRREWPTRVTQRLQIAIQNNVIRRVLASRTKPKPPWPVRVLSACPHLQRIPARLIGIGVRPEHVRTPDVLRGG
jgi:2-polyprenyl-6-methoxyphenol hydroxylase-like FAD-dependent oxidoreductase